MKKGRYHKFIHNNTFLITGGTGSFGHAVLDALLPYKPKKVIVFSRDEKKQFDMRNEFDSPVLRFVIGDVRNYQSVESVMEGVDYVFHAAALKQVPSCEFFPIEAVQTNVIGADNVLRSAISHNVKRVVVLSTDKSVYPINTMGMTKALMEKVMIAHARELEEYDGKKTTVCGVRYGNVLYSRGSVIPYFVDQIKKGKKLTVTNGVMTRFLLPLPQAVDLVLYAIVSGENGFLYVRKAPACTMQTLATAVCNIFSYTKGIEQVGIRAGEKLHETLVTTEEFLRAFDMGEYYKIRPEGKKFDYETYFSGGKATKVREMVSYTSENTERLNLKQTEKLLLSLPEITQELRS
jgi:UDP-N-acetylglucosamine 4,6-dehydratase/5-epimerase